MITRDAISLFSTQINLRHMFEMSAFCTYACFESWMPRWMNLMAVLTCLWTWHCVLVRRASQSRW